MPEQGSNTARGLVRLLLTTAILAAPASPDAQTPALPASLTLQDAVERAVAANPTIAAVRLRRLMSLAELEVFRERLNPEARVEIEREAPTQAYGLAVPLETGGKRSRRIAVGEASVRTSEAELLATIADIRSSVRRAYFGRLVADARLMLQQELQEIGVRAREAAQGRFDAGSAPRLEVLQAELALAEAQNQAAAALGATTAARAELNALLALPLNADVPLASSLDVVVPTPAEAAVLRAQSASAELALLDRRLDEQRARIALARAMQVPDVTPEATITRGQPEFATGWRASVSVAVPLFTRHRAGVVLEEAALTQLTVQRTAAVARITGEVTSAAVLADALRQQFMRYQTQIVPQALEVERLAQDSYQLGQTGIAALLQALQASRDARLRSLQAAADFQSALADLERAIGAPLP